MNATRVTLIATASTAAIREARFPRDEPLDEYGRRAAAAVRLVGDRGRAWCSPVRRAFDTASALGLAPVAAPGLAPWDVGAWAGHGLDEIDPGDLAAWRTDPTWAGHGGESVQHLVARVGTWLDSLADRRVLAVADQAVVRAAVEHAVPGAFWSVEVAPLRRVTLRRGTSGWALVL